MKENRFPFLYLGIFLIIGACIAIAGYQYHKNFEKHFRANVENQLSLIADLKVGELEHWQGVQRENAKTLFGNEVFSDIIKRYLNNPNDRDAKREIQVWLKEFQTGFNYDAVLLTDPQLIKKIVISEATERPRAYISPGNIDSIRAGKLVFEDFYRDDFKQKIFLKILIPILDVKKLIGIIELRIDPKTYIYPLLNNWPMPSETSETLILRNEGNQVVYLNELRFQKNSALNLRIPLEDTSIPAVRAVLGYTGFMEGIDYRGKAVVTYVKKVPNSPWYLVVKVDNSEVYAPLRKDFWLTVLFSFGIFLIAGMGLGFIWRHQRTLVYKEKIKSAEVLRESEERFRMLFDKAPLSYQSLDINANFIDVNQTWLETFGYKREEVIGKWFGDFLAQEYVDSFRKQFPIFKATGKSHREFEMIHKDGTNRYISFEGRIAKDTEGNFIQTHGILQDITQQKKLEFERQVIYEIDEGIATTENLNELLKLIHQSLRKILFADNYFVALHDQNTGLFSFPYYVDQFDTTPEPIEMRKSWTSYVFRTGKPVLFSQELFQQLKEQNEVELVGSPSLSWVGVPLQTPTRTIGVLVLQNYEKENVYSDRDVQFLDSVGSQIAMAVERKQAEEAIKREIDFSQRSLDSLPGLFYLFDDQGKFLRWNKNFEITTGYSAEEIEHLSPLNLFDEPDKTSVAEKIQQVFQIGEASVEADLVSKDRTKTSIFFTGKRFQFENKQCLAGMGIDISDRRQVEEDLRNERLLLRTVIDNIPDSIYCKDNAYRKTLANQTELNYSGANSEADILGKTDFDLYPKELAEGFFADDQIVLQTGQSVLNREEYLFDAHGHKHWLLTSKLPLKDEDGNITGLVGIGRDITERRQAEEDLRESEIKLKVILQSTADGILAVDSNGKVIKTNKRFAELWRIPQHLIDSGDDHALISFVLEQLTNPDEFISKVQKLYNSTDEDLDHLYFKDGRTFERFSAPMVMDDSSIGRVWSFRDITERKLAEEALRESEESYRALFIESKDAMMTLTPDQGFISGNPEAIRMFGCSDEKDFTSRTPADLSPEYQPDGALSTDKTHEMMMLALKKGVNFFEWTHKCIDGTEFPATVLLSRIEKGGKVILQATVRDITELVHAGQEIKLNNEELQKINAEKDKFFSIIAHDLRSPFNGFLGLTQVMAEDLPSLTMAEVQEIALSMKNSATNLFNLLENLLEWAQMQRGLISFNPAAIQLRSMVGENIAMVLESSKPKGIEITFDIPDGLQVFADTNMLQTIIRNLVSNAVKFTHKGGKVSLSAKAINGKGVEISVKDTGIGMNQAMIENLFRIDVQTNRKGTEGEPSTGLGLLLCKEFIEKHGGKLWVESEEGKGSIFYFVIPSMNDTNL